MSIAHITREVGGKAYLLSNIFIFKYHGIEVVSYRGDSKLRNTIPSIYSHFLSTITRLLYTFVIQIVRHRPPCALEKFVFVRYTTHLHVSPYLRENNSGRKRFR